MSNNIVFQEKNISTLIRGSIKPLISLVLLIIILYQIDLSRVTKMFIQVDPVWLLVSFILVIGAIIISALKWQVVFNAQNVDTSITKLIGFYFVGLFFNNFLPTSIGGDVVRVIDSAKYTGKAPESVASVVIERVLASIALGLLAIAAIFINFELVKPFIWLLLIFVFICIMFLFICLNRKVLTTISKIFIKNDELNERLKVGKAIGAIDASLSKKKYMLNVIWLSLLFQFMIVLINVSLIKALGLNVSLVYLLLFIPVINAITLIPVSFNGLGVREWSYIYFFTQIGIDKSSALAISVYFYLVITLASLIGGLIFAFRGRMKIYGQTREKRFS